MNQEIPEATIIDFHKRFANGEQYIELDPTGNIQNIDKTYFWQSQEAFNFIKPITDKYVNKLSPENLYEKCGLVALLIPFQRAYNNIKNKELEYINRLSTGVLAVEDGSIDTDELAEDGLMPGKILVYRSGTRMPVLYQNKLDTQAYLDSADSILSSMYSIAEDFYLAHANEYKGTEA